LLLLNEFELQFFGRKVQSNPFFKNWILQAAFISEKNKTFDRLLKMPAASQCWHFCFQKS